MARATLDGFAEAGVTASNIYQLWRHFVSTVAEYDPPEGIIPEPPTAPEIIDPLAGMSRASRAIHTDINVAHDAAPVADTSLNLAVPGSYGEEPAMRDAAIVARTATGSSDTYSTWLRHTTSEEESSSESLVDSDGNDVIPGNETNLIST